MGECNFVGKACRCSREQRLLQLSNTRKMTVRLINKPKSQNVKPPSQTMEGATCCGLQACRERSAYARTSGTLAAGPLIISSACANARCQHVHARFYRLQAFTSGRRTVRRPECERSLADRHHEAQGFPLALRHQGPRLPLRVLTSNIRAWTGSTYAPSVHACRSGAGAQVARCASAERSCARAAAGVASSTAALGSACTSGSPACAAASASASSRAAAAPGSLHAFPCVADSLTLGLT